MCFVVGWVLYGFVTCQDKTMRSNVPPWGECGESTLDLNGQGG